MDLFRAIDIGTYSTFRVLGLQTPELATIMRGSAMTGAYLWIVFLAILAWRWRATTGRFPIGNLVKVLAIMVAVETLRLLLKRGRPDDAQDYFAAISAAIPNPTLRDWYESFAAPGFPNGPTFRAVLISALMWETTQPGWGRWLGLLGAVLYCIWVIMSQLMAHLGFLTDVLASLSLALGIGFLSPRIFNVERS